MILEICSLSIDSNLVNVSIDALTRWMLDGHLRLTHTYTFIAVAHDLIRLLQIGQFSFIPPLSAVLEISFHMV